MIYFVSNYEDYICSYNIKFVKPDDIKIKGSLLCEDTETIGLDYRVPNPLLLIQIGNEHDQYIFDVRSGIDLSEAKRVLEDRNIEKVLANGIFERHMLRSKGIQINSMFDVALAAKVLRQGREDRQVWVGNEKKYIYSLAGIYKEYLDIEMEKEQQSTFIGHTDTKFTYEQLMYAAKDVQLYDIYEELMRLLLKYDLITDDYNLGESVDTLVKTNRFRKAVLEFKSQEFFADMLYNGIHLSKEKWLALYDRNIKQKVQVEMLLNKELPNIDANKKGWRIKPPEVTSIIQGNLFGDSTVGHKQAKAKYLLNWSSSTQVYPLIKRVLGRDLTDKHGKKTISNKELAKCPEKDTIPFIAHLLEYSNLNKRINTYGASYLENIHPITGRIHFEINQLLETGRIAPKKPNLAQIPSTKEWRDTFTAPPGRKMVGADYAAQESQTMADKSGDTAFIDFFLNGDGDSHSMVATRVYTAKEGREVIVSKKTMKIAHLGAFDGSLNDQFNKLFPSADTIKVEGNYIVYSSSKGSECPLRQKGKVLNFFISFGGSAYTLSIDSNIPIKEAEALIDGFWKGFPQLKAYFDREKEFAIKNGFVVINSITKGRRWFPMWKEYRGYEIQKDNKKKELIKQYGDKVGTNLFYKGMKEKTLGLAEANSRAFRLKGDMERAAMNSGIQGTAADMTKTACILLMETLERDEIGLIDKVKPVNYIHDEVLLDVEEALADYSANVLKESMEKSSTIFLNKLKIKATPYIANEWLH